MNSLAILILAVIAGFLFYQLRSVLGQTPYNSSERKQKRKQQDYITEVKRHNDVIEKPVSITTNHKFIKGNTEEKENIVTVLNEIKDHYEKFNLSDFLEGAKSAYEMVIGSFEKDTLNDVKDFVSEEIFNEFKNLRQSYNDKNYKYMNTITSIESVIVSDASIQKDVARITIEIKSQNVMSLEDDQGNILHGDPKHIKMVTDIWTFERAFSSTSPAWTLISK